MRRRASSSEARGYESHRGRVAQRLVWRPGASTSCRRHPRRDAANALSITGRPRACRRLHQWLLRHIARRTCRAAQRLPCAVRPARARPQQRCLRATAQGRGASWSTTSATAPPCLRVAAVDAVVVFSEDTPLALIEALRPDILVKGADYDRTGRRRRRRAGLWRPCVLVPIMPGRSTSGTIVRLRSARGES